MYVTIKSESESENSQTVQFALYSSSLMLSCHTLFFPLSSVLRFFLFFVFSLVEEEEFLLLSSSNSLSESGKFFAPSSIRFFAYGSCGQEEHGADGREDTILHSDWLCCCTHEEH